MSTRKRSHRPRPPASKADLAPGSTGSPADPPTPQPPAGQHDREAAINGARVEKAILLASDPAAATLQCYLAEYQQSRTEVTAYNERLDKMIIVYLSALFGFVGFFFSSENRADTIGQLVASVQSVEGPRALVLLLTILQPLLMLLAMSYQLNTLRLSKYTSTYLRPRARELGLNSHVFAFDLERNPETRMMLDVRALVGGSWILLLLGIDLLIVWYVTPDLTLLSPVSWALLAISAATNAAAIGCCFGQLPYWRDGAFDLLYDEKGNAARDAKQEVIGNSKGGTPGDRELCLANRLKRKSTVMLCFGATLTSLLYALAVFLPSRL